MNNNAWLDIKHGFQLTEYELNLINEAKAREWNVPPIDEEQKKELFFLLKDQNGKILAHGQLLPIDGVVFDNETFSIMGIGGIISTIRGKGYGRQLMSAIKDYLLKNNKTGIGFTGIPVFYEKCGFLLDKESLKRFVHVVGDKLITNTKDEYLVYFEAEDHFMKKVLSNPDKDVYLPRDPDW